MDTAEPDLHSFDTDVLRERDRLPIFYEEIVRRIAGLDLITQDQCGFKATADFQRSGAIDVDDSYGANSVRDPRGSEPPPSQSELEPRWQRQ